MGDRHNIGIIQRDKFNVPTSILWLYSHNGFYVEASDVYTFAASVAVVLDEARPRWDDRAYFNRIVILTLGDSVRGISVDEAIGDEHKRYVLDPEYKKVLLMDSWNGDLESMPSPIVEFTFEEFITKYRKHDKTVRNEY